MSDAMAITLTMDGAGRLVLPKAFRERLHLQKGAKFRADIVADRIELTPESDSTVKIARKGKRLVITGVTPTGDVVDAIKADRESRSAQLHRRLKGK
jgi:bifunctional DNA-binding transcriptional regulator/antitoxin component of YhaV-PrlF toxin-antitoxin module